MMTRYSRVNMNMYGDCCYEQSEYDSGNDSEYDSDECSIQRRKILGPVQLAPKKCKCFRCNWNGEDKECEQKWITLDQMQAHYNEQLRLKCSELQAETSASIAKMQAEQTAALKSLDEQSLLVLAQHIAFMAALPKESKAGRERREVEKKKAHQEKMSRQVRKGGGFKKRVVKETALEVVKARRASRRKVSRDTKKESEAERAKTFASKVECVEVVEELVKEVVESDPLIEEVVEVVEEVVVVVEEVVVESAPLVEVIEPPLAEEVVNTTVAPKEDCWQEVKPRTKHRTTVHETVASKEDDWQEVKPRKTVACTRMCDSVALKKHCRHSNCRFAHSVTELVFEECFFGKNCNNIGNCIRLHPGETKESVCARAGITIPKVVAVVAQFSKVYMPTLAEATGVKNKSCLPQTTMSAWQKQIKIEPDTTIITRPVVVKVKQVEEVVTTSDTIRADAFAALADPKSIKLVRTRMCDSVSTGNSCRHGASCNFAHTLSELVFPSCLFGRTCRHVQYQGNGVYTIVRGMTCNRLHPDETNASICERVHPTPVVKPVMLKPVMLKPVMLKSEPVVLKPVMLKPVVKSEPVLLTQEETIIKVPKELAMQAIELAMKSGKTNIRVEII